MRSYLRESRKGNVPFALLAVTILLSVTAYGVVAESIKNTESDSESMSDAVEAMNRSVDETRLFVERGLGEIIYSICTSETGNFDQRRESFESRSSSWMDFQFPICASGVTVTLLNYDISLKTDTFRADGQACEGYVPSFLRATGTLEICLESEYGKSEKTLSVQTDGSCALPLTLEMGSLFENAVEGEGPILSQMVKYQLTSLAQYRVMNGYGAYSAYGAKGTHSILTETDVRNAYTNALEALECTYFKDSTGKEYYGMHDLAKEIVCHDGDLTIDLNTVYAQALAAREDDLIGKWFDYFMGQDILNALDGISDTLANAWDAFTSFITGRNDFSAEPYIREMVGDIYTGVYSGRTFTLHITDPIHGDRLGFQVRYPDVDLYGSPVITHFKNDYRNSTNTVREWLRDVLNTAISSIAAGKGLGKVTLRPEQTESFADALSGSIARALRNDIRPLEEITRESFESHKVPDQFYAAIFHAIQDNKDMIFCYSEENFGNNVKSQVWDSLWSIMAERHDGLTDEDMECLFSEAFKETEYREVLKGYRQAVDDLMEKLEALNTKYSQNNSYLHDLCVGMLKIDFFAVDYLSDITSIACAVAEEYRTNITINPYCGFTDFGTGRNFILTDGEKIIEERMSLTLTSDPIIEIGRPSDRSSHETGFSESKYASYCTVIPVTVKDKISFSVTSTGRLLSHLGMFDSVFSDTFEVNISTDIAIVSGWALAGVEYSATVTLLDDIIRTIISALEPLLEPLRILLKMAECIADRIAQALMTVERYLTEVIERIYQIIMEPLENACHFFTETLTDTILAGIISLIEGAQPIVDVGMVGQIIGFTYMGFTLTFEFHLETLEKYTKNIVKAKLEGEVSGTSFSAFVSLKTKGDTKKVPHITGGFSVKGEDWDLEATIDPKMNTTRHLMTLGGTVKGIRIDAVLPEAVQYNELGIHISDIPGIGAILTRLPSPIPGTKLELDAGLELKYNLPIETGVLVNEFESNPEGDDKGHEWAEIINLTGSPVDLNNWTLTTSKKKVHIIKGVELAPGERTVITFDGNFLLNSKEYLILKDPDGVESDRTATMGDSGNDTRTCQRSMDGSTVWGMHEGTANEANSGGLFGQGGIVTSAVKDIVKNAAVRAMGEIRHVYTVEQLQKLLSLTIQYAIDDGIETLSSSIVEGSAYVSADFTDLTSSGRSGFRAYVAADSDLAEDLMKFLLGKIEALFLNIEDPYNIDLGDVFYEDVYVGITVYGGIKAPKMLCASTTEEKVLLGVDMRCNVAALGGLFGCDLGTPKVKVQIGIKNCPAELIPSAMGVKKNMTYDYWFLHMTFTVA